MPPRMTKNLAGGGTKPKYVPIGVNGNSIALATTAREVTVSSG